jgi:hypothetical protein
MAETSILKLDLLTKESLLHSDKFSAYRLPFQAPMKFPGSAKATHGSTCYEVTLDVILFRAFHSKVSEVPLHAVSSDDTERQPSHPPRFLASLRAFEATVGSAQTPNGHIDSVGKRPPNPGGETWIPQFRRWEDHAVEVC